MCVYTHGCVSVAGVLEEGMEWIYLLTQPNFLHISLETPKPSYLSNWRSGQSDLSFCLGKAVAGMEWERVWVRQVWDGSYLLCNLGVFSLLGMFSLNFLSTVKTQGWTLRHAAEIPSSEDSLTTHRTCGQQTDSAASGSGVAGVKCLIWGHALPWASHMQH